MIRAALPSDAPAIAGVEMAAAHAPWTLAMIEGALRAEGAVAFVAEIGGDVVGHALTVVGGDVADLHTIAVRPDARRRGVARALLAAAVDAWSRRGVTEAFLEVRVDNRAARALYARSGWEEVGVRPRYYADGTDAVILRTRI